MLVLVLVPTGNSYVIGGDLGKKYIQNWGARHHTPLGTDAMHALYECVLNGEIYIYSGGGYIFFRVIHPCFDLEKMYPGSGVPRRQCPKSVLQKNCS